VDRILEEYYASNWTGSSVAGMLYVLAELLTKSTPTLLWYGIVGLTDQYINDKIGTEKYSSDLVLYHSAVQRLTPDLPTQSSNGEVSGSFEKERDQQQILVFEEYRFMLYRHWTLYDSMYHSSYMATKLGIWKEKGRKRLHTFLAKMGLALEHCKQRFMSMNVEIKKILRDKINEVSPNFQLDNILFLSFVKVNGYKAELSASDVVYGVSALLEANQSFNIKNIANNDRTESLVRADIWVNNFYNAFDALDDNNVELLMKGIELSMKLQQAIVQQGTSIIERRSITVTRVMKCAILKDIPDLFLFSHPLTLMRLAYFLFDAFRESGKDGTPVVVGAYNELSANYILVGVTETSLGKKNEKKDKFHGAFKEATRQSRAQVKYDGFETGIIEVEKNDLQKFLDVLHATARITLGEKKMN